MNKLNSLLSLTVVALLYTIFVNGTLGLYRFNEWHSVKSFYQNGIMSAQEFVRERQPLAEQRLNLSEWNGFNEVIWDHKIQYADLSFQFELQANSYLWVFIGQSAEKKQGFRFSQNPMYESGFFELDHDELIQARRPFNIKPLENRPHQFLLKTENETKILFIDGEKIAELNSVAWQEQILMFRSSYAKVSIDDVMVKNQSEFKKENFSAPFELKYFLLCCAFVLLQLFVLKSFFKPKNITAVVLTQVIVFAFYSFIDVTWLSSHYYFKNVNSFQNKKLSEAEDNIEKQRKVFFHFIAEAVSDKAAARALDDSNLVTTFSQPENQSSLSEHYKKFYTSNGLDENKTEYRYQLINNQGEVSFIQEFLALPDKKPHEYRILFLGTSQIWGGGARNLNESFPARLIKKLNQNQSKQIVLGLNLAEAGVDSKQQLSQYEFFSELWQADLVIVNLGNNDYIESEFKKNIEEMIQIAKAQHSKIVFLKEANSIEIDKSYLLQKHKIMQSVAEQNQIQILDLHAYISQKTKEDAGLIWWDIVHFSAAGHTLTANWLYEQLKL